jgi:galactose-1-phosphate uridylyltransferase (family 1)
MAASDEGGLLQAKSEKGICRVICFSPRHDLTLPQMSLEDICGVVDVWRDEFETLAADPDIHYIQIFENKGDIMGCSNPHPHGQIWAQGSLPQEIVKETVQQQAYLKNTRRACWDLSSNSNSSKRSGLSGKTSISPPSCRFGRSGLSRPSSSASDTYKPSCSFQLPKKMPWPTS